MLFGAIFACFPIFVVISGSKTVDTELLLVVALFVSIGLGAAVSGVLILKKSVQVRKLMAMAPSEPWLHRADWREGKIRDSQLQTALSVGAFSIVWLAIVSFIFVAALRDKESFAILFTAIFLLIGLGIGAWALVLASRIRKFGISEFELADNPGVVGGEIGGVIYTKVHLPAKAGFKLTLSNIHKITTRSGKNSSTRETVLWQRETIVSEEALPDNLAISAIPVYFEIPHACKQTEYINPNNQILWRLQVEAALPGLNYKASFEVPVFKTKDSRKTQSVSRPSTVKQDKVNPAELSERERIHFTETLQTLRLRVDEYTPQQLKITWQGSAQKRLFIPLLMIGIVVMGLGVIMALVGAPILFPCILLPTSLGMVGFALNSLASSRCLSVENGILRSDYKSPVRSFSRQFASDEVREISEKAGLIINGVQHYSLVLTTGDGTPHRLLSYLKDPVAMYSLQSTLLQRLGLPGGEDAKR